ncbi:glycosyltransferase family 4 protein [Paeniglutamicibacter sp. NPDC091659]|uniref:glycosyltransferase family 4 protein n=1 Tax=Paeniglutamicibacter sp. NPDC091659 TaxID=3364389 RepID=UPI00380CFC6E
MKILVCPHDMNLGGSQLNAIELADKVRALGHEVVIHAPEGVLTDKVRSLGIPYVSSPVPANHKEWRKSLGRLLEDTDIDLIHTYEWESTLDASFSPSVRGRIPLLASVMSMQVPEFLPRHLPLTVGTPALAAELAWQHRTAFLLEPPVDMELNKATDPAAARAGLGLGDDRIVISIATKLGTELEKLQGVLSAIALVDRMADSHPLHLLIAGGGPGLSQVRERARAVNERHQGTVVEVLGYLNDPRPAYEAADIVLGMGASAIKAMAFSKALVVQGEAGFWKTLDEGNAEGFLQRGWFGYKGQGIADLERELETLVAQPELRERLGAFGRTLVEKRYSLDRSAKELVAIYLDLLAHRGTDTLTARAASLLRSAVEVSRFRTVMKSGALTEREKWSHSGVEL